MTASFVVLSVVWIMSISVSCYVHRRALSTTRSLLEVNRALLHENKRLTAENYRLARAFYK